MNAIIIRQIALEIFFPDKFLSGSRKKRPEIITYTGICQVEMESKKVRTIFFGSDIIIASVLPMPVQCTEMTAIRANNLNISNSVSLLFMLSSVIPANDSFYMLSYSYGMFSFIYLTAFNAHC